MTCGLQAMPQFQMEKLPGWGEATHQLAASDCEPLLLPELLAMADNDLHARWEQLSLGYPGNSAGDQALREEIAEGLYGGSLSADNVLGVIPAEGILLGIHALNLQPRDHVICMTPGYASLRTIAAHALGCEVTSWPVEYRRRPGTDSDEPFFSTDTLRELFRPGRTKLVVVNVPHNPTGALPNPQEWCEIVSVCAEHDAYLFSDEMYRHLERQGGQPTLPAAAEIYDRGISLSGLSKAYGLAGLRIGWLASQDAAVLRKASDLKDYTSICAGTPNECLALIALRARQKLWSRCNGIIGRNLELLAKFVASRPGSIEWIPPTAGPIAFPRLLAADGQASAHCCALLRNERVMLIPERHFAQSSGDSADRRVRIGLGRQSMETMLEAWGREIDRVMCAESSMTATTK